jgi:hypothetical protein
MIPKLREKMMRNIFLVRFGFLDTNNIRRISLQPFHQPLVDRSTDTVNVIADNAKRGPNHNHLYLAKYNRKILWIS